MKKVTQVILAILIAFSAAHIQAQTSKKRAVLIVLTSHDQLGNTGKKTGFWIENDIPLLALQ